MIIGTTGASSGPQLSSIPNQTIPMNTGTGPIPFTVSDPAVALASLVWSTYSSNLTLVPLSNIVLGGSGSNRTVTVTPAAGQTGTATITVMASDGTNNASSSFGLTVSAPATQVRVETAANGSGTVVPGQNVALNHSVTVYAIARDAGGNFVTNVPADSWSLSKISGGVAGGDLVAAGDMKSATFTGHAAGSAVIHVVSGALTAMDSGTLTVVTNTPPTISAIPDQTTWVGFPVGPFNFTVGDAETAAGSLVVSAASSDQTLMPNGNFVFYNLGATRTLTVAPAAGRTGTATVTVTVSDGVNSTSTNFMLTVSASGLQTAIFSNNSGLSIGNRAVAGVYPSTNHVSGLPGLTTKVVLLLNDVNHTSVHDLELLLVGPGGQKVVPFAKDGGGVASHIVVGLDDAATYALPSGVAIPSGTYKPTDGGHDAFPAPAPGGPYATSLATFNGVSPVGDWLLYVMNDPTGSGSGNIGGWSLAITTDTPINAPTLSAIANQTIAVNTGTGPIPFTLSDPVMPLDSLSLSTNSSNTTLVPLSNIVLGGSGSNRTVTVAPAAGQTGTSTITVTASDGTNSASSSFVLTVVAPASQVRVETAADGSGTVVPAQNINPGGSITVYAIGRDAGGNFVTNVPADSWSLTNVSGGVVNSDLVAAADMKSATFTGHVGGSAAIHVSSGVLVSTDSGVLTVLSSAPPVITPIADKTTLVGRSAGPFPITITDADTPVGALILSGASSDQTLVPNTNIFIYNSGAQSLTVTPAPNRTGTATITLTASDGVNVTSNSFLLTVIPPAPGTRIFDNTSPITIPDTGTVAPYPATINVSGMAGSITNLTLTLKNLTTPAPHDLEMLLVGPTGQKAIVFSSAGGGTASNILVTLDDAVSYALPPTPFPIPTGTYRPTDLGHVDPFPSPAPAGPYTAAMSTFKGLSPDGNWNLYVIDTVAGNGASTIAGGWSLAVSTDQPDTFPSISSIPAQAIIVNSATAAIPFMVGDAETPAANLTLSASSSNPALVPTNQIVFGGTGTNRTVTVTPSSNQVGTATLTVTVSDGTLTTGSSFVLTVNPFDLTVAIDNATRVYGTTNPAFTGTLTGLQPGDNITATFTTAAAATNSQVGSYPIVPLYSDPGGKLGIYRVITNGGTLTITKASLIVTATGTNRVYNGTTTAGVTFSDNRLPGDNLTANCTNASFPDKNVGTGKPISVSGITISGPSATNYACNTTASTSANITVRALVVSSPGVSKVYDGTTAAPIVLVDNRMPGDNLAVTYANASFADKNSALGKALSVSGIVASGTDVSNYTYNTTINTIGDITPAGLTIAGVTAQDKVYDGTTTATPNTSSAALVGVVSGDAVTLNAAAAVGTFDTKSVGTSKTVRVTGLTLGGADATNYTLTQMIPSGLVAAYAFREGAGTTVADASGNGNTGTLANTTWTNGGRFGSALVFNGTSAFVTINDSTLLHLTTGMTLEAWENPSTVISAWHDVIYKGNDNYYLSGTSTSSGRPATGGTYTAGAGPLFATAALTTNAWAHLAATYDGATIRLYVNGVQVASRAQTGNIATSTNSLQIGGDSIYGQFFRGEIDEVRVYNVALTPGQIQADMSTPIPIYSPLATTASITPSPLTVSGITALSKVYDATTNATINVSLATLNGVLAGDVVTLNAAGATGAFGDKMAATGKTVTVTGLTVGGADATNYMVSPPSGLTADITTAPLTVIGISADSRVYDGTTAATLHTSGATLVGAISGDSLTLNVAGATGAFTDSNLGNGKTVNVSGLTLGGPDAPNYQVNPPATTANITPASTTIGLVSGANPSVPGAAVPITATVGVVAPGGGTPTGSVQFLTNGVAWGTGLPVSNAVAVINIAFGAPGSNTVSAVYSGDVNFIGSTNTLVQIVITQPPLTLGIKANGDQTVIVSFSGTPGANYIVQVTGDLSSPAAWSNAATNTAGADGTWTFTDSVTTHPRYYYRSARAP
jgi:hypothetical protein